MSALNKMPSVLERHELKYTIPYSYIESITRFIAPYCSLDHHSTESYDNFYLVNSLYFDTRNLEFLNQRLWGKDGRFNMRLRFYGDGNQSPYYLEIKHKQGTTSKKYRATIEKNEWPNILTDPTYRINTTNSSRDCKNKEMFLLLATSYAIEPKLLTQYRRRAFFSTIDEYARITMDISMKYKAQDNYHLKPDLNMISYDNETIYTNNSHNDASVILELKCNIGQVPMWMLDLIAVFDLKQQGFSKYLSSSLVSHYDDGIHYMQTDRQAHHYQYD